MSLLGAGAGTFLGMAIDPRGADLERHLQQDPALREAQDTDSAAAVLAAEDRLVPGHDRHRPGHARRMLDDRLSYAHSSGARDTKAEYLEKVRSGYYDYLRVDHPVERVEVVGDTAIVVGRMTCDLTVQGTPKTIDNLALAVWARAAGTGGCSRTRRRSCRPECRRGSAAAVEARGERREHRGQRGGAAPSDDRGSPRVRRRRPSARATPWRGWRSG